MKIGYFPGCSLHATSRELSESLLAIAPVLGLELDEVRDWNCCGATSAHATNHLLSVALAARTLALSSAQQHTKVMAPCAACYSRLATARHELRASQTLASKVADILKKPVPVELEVQNVVDLLHGMLPEVKAKVSRPLKGLRVACYYGCLLVRPTEVTAATEPEDPQTMRAVVKTLGAEPVSWNMSLTCCGGGFSIARTGSVLRLGRQILDDARCAGAHAVVVACPMCQSNLDLRQQAMARAGETPSDLPIFFITQLVGLAFGLEASALGLQRHFVSTAPVVASLERKALPQATEQA